ncbi:D-hexose-6-phosphate mutarotase [Enterobacteriaceae bacterium LUAb1]
MNTTLFSLPVSQQLSPYVTVRQFGSLPVVVINHPGMQAAVSLQGAHLLAWQPAGEKAVIWLSEKTPLAEGQAIRGGIPVCWPWFGPAGNPAHGFARNQLWVLSDHHADTENVIVTLYLNQNEQTLTLWPHAFTLYAHFRFTAERCEIELEAHGEYESSAALHSYFSVADINDVTVSGLGHRFIDKVNNNIEGNNTDGKQRYNGRVDRIYTQPENCTLIHDPASNRILEVAHHYQSDVVTWNPGAELSRSMKDMPDDGYKQFVCVETARIHQPLISTADSPARLATTFCIRKC